MRPLETAYKLLPPPLSALPAKYWTNISLWLHSYTVARTFQELLKLAGVKEKPSPDEAFIIGFTHDFVQKLGKSPNSIREIYSWIREKLENELGWASRKVRNLIKVLETNPAENIRKTTYVDPSLRPEVWELLMLADELHGSIEALSWARKVVEVLDRKFGKKYYLELYTVNIPQPFVRSLLWSRVEEYIRKKSDCSEDKTLTDCGVFAVASAQGLVVISRDSYGIIEISWDNLIGRRTLGDDTEALSKYDIDVLKKHVLEGCRDKKLSKSDKYKEFTGSSVYFKSFVEKYCKKRKEERAGTYKLILHYYGTEIDGELGSIYLPKYASAMMHKIAIKDVRFEEGEYICPICGARHREGFVAGLVGHVLKSWGKGGAKTEKWNRFLNLNMGKNLNQMLRETGKVRVCPLCMLDMFLGTRNISAGLTIYYTLSLKTPIPVPVLHEILGIMNKIIREAYKDSQKIVSPNAGNILEIAQHPEKIVEEATPRPSEAIFDYGGVSVSTNGGLRFSDDATRLKLQEKLMLVSVAGLLAYYGLYPITISVGYPPLVTTPAETIINYETMYPIYNYNPRTERNNGVPITPYVTSILLLLPKLYRERDRQDTRRYVRHIEEILGFSPRHAPLFLLYSSPELYSHVSGLISMFMRV